MRYVRYVVCLLLLSACNSTPAPTATVTSAPLVLPQTGTEEPTFTPVATIQGELPIPLPGTLVASETEDPNAAISFNTLTLIRSGGPQESSLNIEIRDTGVMMRDGTESQVSQTQLNRLNMLIRDMNFFGMQNTYLPAIPANGNTDVFLYSITASRAGEERTINAADGYMPDELQTLIAEIIQIPQ